MNRASRHAALAATLGGLLATPRAVAAPPRSLPAAAAAAPSPAAPPATPSPAAAPAAATGAAPRTAALDVQSETAEVRLARGRQAYDRGDYQETIRVVEPLVYPTVLLGADEEIVAHRLLALSHFFLREVDAAEQEFTTLLQLKEDFTLDPLLDPATALQFLDRIRRRNREKLDELATEKRREEEARHRALEEAKRRAAQPTIVERSVEKHLFVLNFVPLGAGQFQNGDRKKGYFFLVSEIALAAGWAAMVAATYATFPSGRYPAQSAGLASAMQWAQVAAGAAFWIDVGAGVVDSLVGYVPEVVRERRIEPAPLGNSPRPPSPSAPRPTGSRSTRHALLTPYLTAGPNGTVGGLTLQGAF